MTATTSTVAAVVGAVHVVPGQVPASSYPALGLVVIAAALGALTTVRTRTRRAAATAA